MNLRAGDCFSIKTKTKDDLFGDCIWKVSQIGMPNKPDVIVCVLVGGTGKSARPGYTVMESKTSLHRQFASGAAKLVDEATAQKFSSKPAATSGICELD